MSEHPADLDPIELARDLIRIDSVNSDLVAGAAGETAIAGWCADWLGARGFEVHWLGTAQHPTVVGIARGTGGGRSLMLNGHLDTVGVASYDGDPFAAEVRDGRLFGRGAFDMKTGVAAILVAAARASGAGSGAGAALAGDVIVTLVADEEFGSRGTEDALAAFAADAAIVTEPSELNLVLAHRGFAWFEVELSGLAAHGSMPHQGVDAIAHAGLVLRAIDELRARLESRPPHPLLGHGAVRVSMISGGTDAATVADSCTLTLERRTLPGETPDAVEAELRAILDGLAAGTPDFRYELRRLVARGAFEADPDWPIVRAVIASAKQVFGAPPATRGEPFWTDAGLILEAGIPCLLVGVDGGGAHADTEWATTASVEQLTDLLEGTIRTFCA
ncbi:ArgE/DapE family deacylase [Leifsonia bigeumensis]|uniref:ArgE/DapE family deacylase n=1 Tax=Leifsonella bigeumensis TaxID=433643 RepID=A0ABP7F0D2_9MICO